ncbi:mitochondrial carrier protein, partial [Oryctes borbonicus]
ELNAVTSCSPISHVATSAYAYECENPKKLNGIYQPPIRFSLKIVAGTVGAIVTCPLEVVKTRQQSSKSGFHEPILPQIAQDFRGSKSTTYTTVPVQSRRLWTCSRQCRPQVVALSGYVATKATPSMSILQCLKHIVKNE